MEHRSLFPYSSARVANGVNKCLGRVIASLEVDGVGWCKGRFQVLKRNGGCISECACDTQSGRVLTTCIGQNPQETEKGYILIRKTQIPCYVQKV